MTGLIKINAVFHARRYSRGMVRRSATLCLFILLSILSIAVAPLSGSAGTLHVICGTDGPQTIMLDAQGVPLDPADCRNCPNCICHPSFNAAPPGRGAWTAPAPAMRRADPGPGIARTNPKPSDTRPVARGPPAEKVRNHV